MPTETERRINALTAEIALLKGEPLGSQAMVDVRWYRELQRSSIQDLILADMPKTTYCQMAGATAFIVEEHGKKYGIPLAGKSVDLFGVIKAFHDFFAKNRRALDAASGINKLADEKVKFEVATVRRKAELLDLEVQERRRSLVSREEVLQKLSWISKRLRSLGERIGKTYGPDAQLAVNEFLEEMAAESESGKLRIEGES